MAGQYLIFYDGTCLLCQRTRSWLQKRDPNHAFTFINSRDDAAMSSHPHVNRAEAQGKMIVLHDGRQSGGYDGVIELMRELPGWKWARPLLALPLIRPLGRLAYRFIARHRYQLFGKVNCDAGTCRA